MREGRFLILYVFRKYSSRSEVSQYIPESRFIPEKIIYGFFGYPKLNKTHAVAIDDRHILKQIITSRLSEPSTRLNSADSTIEHIFLSCVVCSIPRSKHSVNKLGSIR